MTALRVTLVQLTQHLIGALIVVPPDIVRGQMVEGVFRPRLPWKLGDEAANGLEVGGVVSKIARRQRVEVQRFGVSCGTPSRASLVRFQPGRLVKIRPQHVARCPRALLVIVALGEPEPDERAIVSIGNRSERRERRASGNVLASVEQPLRPSQFEAVPR